MGFLYNNIRLPMSSQQKLNTTKNKNESEEDLGLSFKRDKITIRTQMLRMILKYHKYYRK